MENETQFIVSDTPPVDLANKKLQTPPKSLWRETAENMVRNPSAVLGMVILLFLIFIAIFAPLIATHDPEAVLLDVPEEGASTRLDICIHSFGCPKAGDDLLSKTASG